jgi:Na+-translocating ferredoxin:NAD+ oxidoreductase subunit B
VTPVLAAAALLGGLGLLFGVILALADRFLRVEEDPRIDAVIGMLPGTNCGACGQPGCRGLAEKIVAGLEAPGRCTVSSKAGLEAIADFLGVDAGGSDKLVARVHCGGGLGRARALARYEGPESCRAAHLIGGGGLECSWGCLGLADCVRACTFDVMAMNPWRLPVVETAGCTACGDCVDACPRDLIELMPLSQSLIVQCRAPLVGDAARQICRAVCDACGRCAADLPEAVRMEGGLPVVTVSDATHPRATWRCPTGAIAWVEGDQFQITSDAVAAAAGSSHV